MLEGVGRAHSFLTPGGILVYFHEDILVTRQDRQST